MTDDGASMIRTFFVHVRHMFPCAGPHVEDFNRFQTRIVYVIPSTRGNDIPPDNPTANAPLAVGIKGNLIQFSSIVSKIEALAEVPTKSS